MRRKFDIPPDLIANNTTKESNNSTSSKPTTSRHTPVPNESNFLQYIENGRRDRDQPNTNNPEREKDTRKLIDPTRRKFAAQVRPVEEIMEDQHRLNQGLMRQREIDVKIGGGGGEDGHQYMISSFDDDRIALSAQIRSNLTAMNYHSPLPIQGCVIPLVQITNKDILCLASTGCGKTGAFMIPIVQKIQTLISSTQGDKNTNSPLAIVVAHTRELVEQLWRTTRCFACDTGVGVALARGAMPTNDSLKQLRDGCDILVTTPGRLHDYLTRQFIIADKVQFLVIDEADKFISEDDFTKSLRKLREDIGRNKSAHFRTLMFSATLNEMASFIVEQFLSPDYFYIQAGKYNQTVAHIRQCVLETPTYKKMKELRKIMERLSNRMEPENGEHFCYRTPKTLIFVNETRICDRVAIALSTFGFRAMSINRHRDQEQRHKAVDNFRQDCWDILVGTDVIARGMNFPYVNYVILYDMPPIHRYEQYVHRVGRTGRTGFDDGTAFVLFDSISKNDTELLDFLLKQLRGSGQPVPPFLEKMEQDRDREIQRLAQFADQNAAAATDEDDNFKQIEDGGSKWPSF